MPFQFHRNKRGRDESGVIRGRITMIHESMTSSQENHKAPSAFKKERRVGHMLEMFTFQPHSKTLPDGSHSRLRNTTDPLNVRFGRQVVPCFAKQLSKRRQGLHDGDGSCSILATPPLPFRQHQLHHRVLVIQNNPPINP